MFLKHTPPKATPSAGLLYFVEIYLNSEIVYRVIVANILYYLVCDYNTRNGNANRASELNFGIQGSGIALSYHF